MNIKSLVLVPVLFVSLFLSISCGKKDSVLQNGFEVTQSSIIVGGLDWEEITTLKSLGEERTNSFGVAHVDLPAMGSRCTGFLISSNIVMTNQHCIPSAAYARGVTVSFNVEEGIEKGREERFDCSEFVGNNKELDFALLKCKGNPGQKYKVLELSTSNLSSDEQVYVIQQNCDYYDQRDCYYTKKISFGTANLQNGSITHDADTLGGSSGSPVFSSITHKVVGIHHAGLGNNGQGRGIENYAVPMKEIVTHILAFHPQVLTSNAPAPVNSVNNDTFEGASSLSIKKVMSGKIGSVGDLDYFKFTLSKTSKISIKLNISGGKDLDLYVYNSKKKQLAKSESIKPLEEIGGTAPAGTYYVLVKGYKGAMGSYKLIVE